MRRPPIRVEKGLDCVIPTGRSHEETQRTARSGRYAYMTPLPPSLLFALEAAQERLHGISALLDALGTSQSPAHAAKVREWASRSRRQLEASIETAMAHYREGRTKAEDAAAAIATATDDITVPG